MKVLGFVARAICTTVFAFVNAVCYFAELYKAYKAKTHLDIGWDQTMKVARVVAVNRTAEIVGFW